jgi:hypothetical protein
MLVLVTTMTIENILLLINECSKANSEKQCKYKYEFKDKTCACSIIPAENSYKNCCINQGQLEYFNNWGKRDLYYECIKK